MIETFLRWIARFRLPLWFGSRVPLSFGNPEGLDAAGSREWMEYRSSDKLFEAWSPVADTLWEAYHCPTLFAALEQFPVDKMGVAPDEYLPEWLRHELPAPHWLDAQTWLILDGPGTVSVSIAAQVVSQQLCQPVCTFDNWPHPQGLIKPEVILAVLLRFASKLARVRRTWHKGLPPVWICDSQRLGVKPGKPRDFDNRYYFDDSILPGIELLRQQHLQRVVYASLRVTDPPTLDINGYLAHLQKRGMPILRIGVESEEAWRAGPSPAGPIPDLPFKQDGFFRSTSGGFGAPVPDPSSSSG